MGYGGSIARQKPSEGYTREQVKAVLTGIGIRIETETYTDFLGYCPFHGNSDTPSFSVGLESGLYLCFNPACGEKGNLINLVKYVTKRNDFEAMRFIHKKAGETQEDTVNRMIKVMDEPADFTPWHPDVLAKLQRAMTSNSPGMAYMKTRGFTEETVNHFEVGYSENQGMVAVPVHSPGGIPVGIVGRSITEKTFKNSGGLPRNKTLFNIHRAKRQGDIVIVTESSFDAMRVHQAGYPNVVGTLGGHMSPQNYALLDRYFNMVIIMTDNDDHTKHIYKNCRKCHPNICMGHNPGRDLGKNIAATLRNKNVMWASYDFKEVYPHGAKDAGDMTDDEIRQCIDNSVSTLEYLSWGLA